MWGASMRSFMYMSILSSFWFLTQIFSIQGILVGNIYLIFPWSSTQYHSEVCSGSICSCWWRNSLIRGLFASRIRDQCNTRPNSSSSMLSIVFSSCRLPILASTNYKFSLHLGTIEASPLATSSWSSPNSDWSSAPMICHFWGFLWFY